MLLKFEAVSRPVLLAQGLKILPALSRAFGNWRYREVARENEHDPVVNVLLEGGDYILQAPWLAEPTRCRDEVGLAQTLVDAVQQAWLRERSAALWVHGVAVEFDHDLVVFLGSPRSGKSLLGVCHALAGQRIFADGLLPILPQDRAGLSLGVAPRIRLPLPENLSWPVRSALAMQAPSGSERQFHFSPGAGKLARLGEQASIRAFVLLDRKDGAAATLRAARRGTILKRMVLHSGSEGMTAAEVLQGLQALVASAGCFRLTFSDADAACTTLRARFAMWTSAAECQESELLRAPQGTRRKSVPPRNPSGRRFDRPEGLREHAVEGDLFLVDRHGDTIYHLNGIGAGLWHLLDGSHGLNDVIAVLQDAFPYVDGTAIEEDVLALVCDLTERGLLVERQGVEHRQQ